LPGPLEAGNIPTAAEAIIAAARRLLANRALPILIALDGPSGAGKSTVAGMVAEVLAALVVPRDDFFAAGITDAGWEARSARDRAADAIDWRRLRREALEPLLGGGSARWHAFDFDAGPRPDGTYAMRTDFVERLSAPLIVLEGAYSTRPELADLINLPVFVHAPQSICHERLAAREDAGFLAAWHARWDSAENYYFTQVRPVQSFDLVVSTVATRTAQ
jgi:uridine kinase